jgi:hypothetical protein
MLDGFFMFFLFENLLNDLAEDRKEFLKVETNHTGTYKSYVLHNLTNLMSRAKSF